MADSATTVWPELRYEDWSETCSALHRWTQVVGKVRLALTPWLNHSWHVPLYVTATGLGTSPIAYGPRIFEIQFDFVNHQLHIAVSDGSSKRLPLRPQSVAEFFSGVMSALDDLGIAVTITELPCEIEGAVPFSRDDVDRAYDAHYAHRFWCVLLQTDRVFKQFRTGFIGKCSPVHFFWGSFDLAVTRFSGRRAPAFTGKTPGVAASVMQDAYSHEVSSAGFWPGSNGVDAAFYSYAYPEPPGFRDAAVQPPEAFFSSTMREFLLPMTPFAKQLIRRVRYWASFSRRMRRRLDRHVGIGARSNAHRAVLVCAAPLIPRVSTNADRSPQGSVEGGNQAAIPCSAPVSSTICVYIRKMPP